MFSLTLYTTLLFFHYSIYLHENVDAGKQEKEAKVEKVEKEGEEKEEKGENEGVKAEKEGEKAMQNSRAAVADQLCTSQISSASRLSECLQSKLNALKLFN